MPDMRYAVHALRYAQSVGERSSYFYRYDLSGEPDGRQDIDWYFWLLQGNGKTVLVDCGFDQERAARKGRYGGTDPRELLSRAGVRAADVDHVIISHAHYDHVGNIGLFPQATFTMARSEYQWITGPYADRFPTCWTVEREERDLIENLHRDGRFTLVDGRTEVFPGIEVRPVGGHTPGQTLTEVTTDSGQIVLASDAAHLYEELEQDKPFNMLHDLDRMFATYEELRELSARPGTSVIAGHDPIVGRSHAEVEPDCFDLTRPVGP
ncbi:N-acyl homoserine lactonase family protein [Streptomyces sp. NPDC002790]|uniref:N-acyl homoserine lactonase family protein n=1 Tax=Streptomyces sp. NPDC002790 TaxID=3154431 RepID=UPI00331F38F2